MKIINPDIEIMRSGLEIDPGIPEQFIEKVGRTCYKSEDKITDTSAAKFVSGLVKRGHEAMIEHWNLIFKTDGDSYNKFLQEWIYLTSSCGEDNERIVRSYLRFTKQHINGEDRYVISGNMRSWRDYARACANIGFNPNYMGYLIRNYPLFFPEFQNWIVAPGYKDVLIPIAEKDLVGEKERGVHHCVTVKFVCDRGVSHEIVRHRTASFAQESTRYCNYSKDKYGNEITVVNPAWTRRPSPVEDNRAVMYDAWEAGCKSAEKAYFEMLEFGATPQEARSVLPNSLKTEVIMTGNLDCWDHFFHLRCAPDAHPDIQVVAKMVRDEFWKLFPERYCQESNLNNGMERTVTIYTADGEIIAQYTGLIDLETNDGGYVKFDFEGKRYIYYNCFVETIAEIG